MNADTCRHTHRHAAVVWDGHSHFKTHRAMKLQAQIQLQSSESYTDSLKAGPSRLMSLLPTGRTWRPWRRWEEGKPLPLEDAVASDWTISKNPCLP